MFSTTTRIVGYVVIWYGISIGETICNKSFFKDYPYPVTVSLSHMLATVILLYPILILNDFPEILMNKSNVKYIVMLGVVKVFVSIFSLVSILKLSLPYSQTIKSLQPIVTIVLARIVSSEQQVDKVYISVCLITVGVAIATITEYTLVFSGVFASLIVAVLSVIGSFFSKLFLTKLKMHPFVLLFNIHVVAVVTILPIWLVSELPSMLHDELLLNRRNQIQFLKTFTTQGVLSFGSHITKFLVLNLVSSLTYSVINVGKSLFKILLGFIFYTASYSITNIVGTVLAVSGVVLYNKTRAELNKVKLA